MDDSSTALYQQHVEWQAVLGAYDARAAETRATQPEFDGWLPRIFEIEGVPTESLSAIHGKLIAHDFLKVRLDGRSAGINYHLGPLARKVLDAETPDPTADDEDTPDADAA